MKKEMRELGVESDKRNERDERHERDERDDRDERDERYGEIEEMIGEMREMGKTPAEGPSKIFLLLLCK